MKSIFYIVIALSTWIIFTELHIHSETYAYSMKQIQEFKNHTEYMQPSCPKTYVYNIEKLQTFKNDTGYGNIISQRLHMYDVDQHELGKIIFSTIFRSKCITEDPNKASVFIVPVLSPEERSPTESEWKNGGTKIKTVSESTKEVLDKLCPTLPYIELKYANKGPHVFISDRFFSLEGFCQGHAQFTPNFTFSHIWVSNTIGQLSIAYPSAVNVNNKNTPPPWIQHQQRKYLMAYGASSEGSFRSKKIRAKIESQCKSSTQCKHINLGQYVDSNVLLKSYYNKFKSTFCIEPSGYGPERKSMMDSLLLGCIPVIISDQFVINKVWKDNWWWYKNASIQIRENLILTNRLNIHKYLAKISEVEIYNMRKIIAQNAHTVHWGRFHSSAFDTFLNAIWKLHDNH